MARKAKQKPVEVADLPPKLLVGSYTKETAGNLLRKNGVMLRHKDVKKELYSRESMYRLLMQSPARAIHNQSLMQRVLQTKDYVQEKLTNIIFAMTAVKAKDPSNKKPLSEKRQAAYNDIQDSSNTIAKEAFQLSQQHDKLYSEIFANLNERVKAWRKLCRDSAKATTNALRSKGFELPDDFEQILQKHLERSGSNEISANELSELGIKGKLSYAEMALVCALKEIENHATN